MSVRFGRAVCGDLAAAERREWLVSNGIGGYACGTIAGVLARRYHGLLIAATDPPVARTLLAVKIDEIVSYGGARFALAVNRWADGTVDPAGHTLIESFALDGTAPVWRYACADALVEKRVWMAHGANATFVRYTVMRATGPLELAVRVFVDARDHHGTTHAGGAVPSVTQTAGGLRFAACPDAPAGRVACDKMTWTPDGTWYRNYGLARERERGLDSVEDHLCAARGTVALRPGDECTIALGDERADLTGAAAAWETFAGRERETHARWYSAAGAQSADAPGWIERLALVADQFVVAGRGGATVIAGYPWFTDWGRDTMIALPGLMLVTGRTDVAKSVLSTFAGYVDRGMIPNRFPDGGEAPEYNTADATLWFALAACAYVRATGDVAFARRMAPVFADIVDWHVRGTRFGIGLDPSDGLLRAGTPGVQLTWMDAKVGDWVVTPRMGKPIEINALWLNALAAIGALADAAGTERAAFDQLAASARAGFARFWNADRGFCYDVLDGPAGHDATLRPNQIFAVSLPESALDLDQMRRVVDACARSLLVSYGLRSLTPDDGAYRARYEGDPSARDGAYHQGTVWSWLLGPFALAHHRAYGDARAALALLAPVEDALTGYGLGTLGEIFDGDPPHAPRGCIAQAWSVAETLRAWTVLRKEMDR